MWPKIFHNYLFFGHNALIDQLLRVNVQDIGMFLDNAVHNRLGEHGLIDLIMPMFPVPNQINYDILVERSPVLGGDAAHVNDSFGIISVDMENGGVDHATHVSAVRRGSGVPESKK